MGREREGASDKGDKWQESKESHSTKAYEGAEQTWKEQSKDRAQVKADDLGDKGRISSASGFEIFDSSKAMKADAKPDAAQVKSPFSTGVELHGKELDQAGIKHENVKHEISKDAQGTVHEKSTVKYPDGLEVTVHGTGEHTQQTESGRNVKIEAGSMTTVDHLPKGYEVTTDGDIKNGNGDTVAHINGDGTVSVKVKGEWVRQGPNGVSEDEGVLESHQPKGGVIGHIRD